MVGHGACVVDVLVAHHHQKVDALRVQHPLGVAAVALGPLAVLDALRLPDKHLGDVRDTPQGHHRQHVAGHLLQEHVVLRVAYDVALGRLVVEDAQAQDELLRVVIGEDHVKVVLVLLVDLLGHLRHAQLLVDHHLAVQLDAQQPGADALGVDVLVGHLEVGAHRLLVLPDEGGLGVGVVPDLDGLRHRAQGGVLELHLRVLGRLAVLRAVLAQGHGEGGRADLLGDVDDLLEARHAQGDVLGGDARVVECVEGHLRGGLADGLRRHAPDHLPRVDHRLLEALLDLAQQPVEGGLAQAVLAAQALGAQHAAHQALEQQRGVLLGLEGDAVLARHHHELLQQRPHLGHHRGGVEVRVVAQVDAEVALCVPDHAPQVERQGPLTVPGGDHFPAQQRQVGAQLLQLLLQRERRVAVALQLRDHVRRQHALVGAQIVQVEREGAPHLLLGELEVLQLLLLDAHRVHAVLPVQELHDVPVAVAHRAVVLHHHVLHRLHQPALDVARLTRLHRRVDQALAAAHGVEEELLRGQPPQVRVLHEAARLGPEVVLGEVRQRAVQEPERDALALHVLLAHARDHLRDVDEGTLAARGHHLLHVVGLAQRGLRRVARLVARLVEHLVDPVLEGLLVGAAGLLLQRALLRLLDEVLHLLLGLADDVVDVEHGVVVRHRVTDADAGAVVQQPVVHQRLDLVDHRARRRGAVLQPGGVDQAALLGAHRVLAHDAREQLPLVDQHLRVPGGEVVRLAVLVPRRHAPHVHLGQDEGEHLLARPQRARLEDGGDGHAPVKVLHPHHRVHHHVLLQEGVALAQLATPQQGVLDDAHHGAVGLRRHDAPRGHHHLLRLGAGLEGLRHVQVHLVPVEVGVVRGGAAEVEAEGGVGQHAHFVAHDGHLVQRGLPVEEHEVAVLQVALHLEAVLEAAVAGALVQVAQVEAHAVLADDEAGAHLPVGGVRAHRHELLQALDVVGGDRLRHGQVARDGPGHAHLVHRDVGVGRDHRARREVDALAHQVAADAPLLALEALRDGLDGPPRALRAHGHPGDGVVHVGHDVVLQHLLEVLEEVLRGAQLLLLPQPVVGAHDLRQLVRQVVLGARGGVHHDARADRGRRHGQHREHHPVGARVARVEPQHAAVLVADLLEDLVHARRAQLLLALHLVHGVQLLLAVPALAARGLELRDELHAVLQRDLGLPHAGGRAHRDARAHLRHARQPLRGLLDAPDLQEARVVARQQQLRGAEAHRAQDLQHGLDEARVEHRLRQLDVPKVPGAVEGVGRVRGALEHAVHRAQPQVVHAPMLGLAVLARLRQLDVRHRARALQGDRRPPHQRQ
eukprot:scaffold4543_cov350-Prasinococcus_capsulatus_cf.AAC.1